MTIQGSCLCRGIAYDYAGKLGPMTVCHCSQCRKVQGSVTVVTMDASELTWKGADLLTEFESTPGKKRTFCRMCGTAMYSRRDDYPKVLRVRVGTIDTPITQIPVAHIYAKDLPPWAAIENDWPQCPELEPGAKR